MRIVSGWLVLLPFSEEEVMVTPQEGVELKARVAVPNGTYHRMVRQPNHTIAAFPDCASALGFEIRIGGPFVPIEESYGQALGAVRCPNCRWE